MRVLERDLCWGRRATWTLAHVHPLRLRGVLQGLQVAGPKLGHGVGGVGRRPARPKTNVHGCPVEWLRKQAKVEMIFVIFHSTHVDKKWQKWAVIHETENWRPFVSEYDGTLALDPKKMDV